ncbi:unnamed protein product [Caenorhabditis auriculariae]|uniref:G-protein coupled receptors family 1 profile domain-containing protein n=1 Tax=Caenorhabditis auriculariae TaxID=2777116 RepID=A0A8S1HVT5_9PELO|nr:unnamed protein product [Caenorhabditis auriculariae]
MFDHIHPAILPLGFFFFFCSLIGCTGNFIMVLCFFIKKRLRSPCHILITLTCLLDLLHQAGQFPFVVQLFGNLTCSQAQCYYMLILPIVGFSSGGPMILSLGLDRFIAVRFPSNLNGPAFKYFTYSSSLIYLSVVLVYAATYVLLKTGATSKRFKAVFKSIGITVAFVLFGWVTTTTANTCSYVITKDVFSAQLIQMYAGITVNTACTSNVFVFYAINSEYREVIKSIFGVKSQKSAFDVSSTHRGSLAPSLLEWRLQPRMTSIFPEGVGWNARGDREPPCPRVRPFFPRLKHAFALIPLAFRLCVYTISEWWNGRAPFIDIFHAMWHFSYAGIGCGSIGTDYRGAFGRFSLLPGIKEQMTPNVKADNFIVTLHSLEGALIYQSLLSCAKFRRGELSSWQTMNPKNIRYRGLYPRAWREFRLDETGVTIVCEQLSPVIVNNYEDSSLPVTNFKFHVINETHKPLKVSITFTFRNGTGQRKWQSEGWCRSQRIQNHVGSGLTLAHTINETPITYAIMAENFQNQKISTDRFDPSSDGSSFYKTLGKSGNLLDSRSSTQYQARELGVAVCVEKIVSPRDMENIMFTLVWHMPEVMFGAKQRKYRRRYTRFFPGICEHRVAEDIATYSLSKNGDWQREIEAWQSPILDDEKLPAWYRSALFNELYYVTDGGTVWFEYDESWSEMEPSMSELTKKHMKEYGRFGYLESWEYFMMNTYDVHFYACWALLKNWPNIEISLQLDFADQICRVDSTKMMSMVEGESSQTKKFSRVPHDLGHPMAEPWIHINSYMLHDSSEWRDLNLKYVIGCWRDWKFVGKDDAQAMEQLEMFYSTSKLVLDSALTEWDVGRTPGWDRADVWPEMSSISDNDGMIENSGHADQTYDIWRMTGTSAYCGSLWLAALTMFVAMARRLRKEQDVQAYSTLLKRATVSFIDKLWNGSCFSFDEDPKNADVVMADQLAGFWALALSREQFPIEKEMLISSLKTIYETNVMSYQNGQLGAVNGKKTSGNVDSSSIQSEEVWTGIVYSVSSMMVEMHLLDEAFETSHGLHNSLWNRYPLQYQTPEAITSFGMYRAIGYMRPLSIWAIQHSLENCLA